MISHRATGFKKVNLESREAIMKKSSVQYGMKFSIENVFSLRALSGNRKQDPGWTFSIDDDNSCRRAARLAAQCEIPSHIAQYPLEIVSQRGVSHPFALFS